jgi:hypothetical protein
MQLKYFSHKTIFELIEEYSVPSQIWLGRVKTIKTFVYQGWSFKSQDFLLKSKMLTFFKSWISETLSQIQSSMFDLYN